MDLSKNICIFAIYINKMEKRNAITNNYTINSYKVLSGQINKNQPWSAYLAIGCYCNPKGKDINKTMTSVERLFRIQVEDNVKKIFIDDLPLFTMKDVQWSDSDHIDLSNQYSYVYFEITLHWSKDKKINIKKDNRFQLVANELINWLVANNLVSFVAKNPKKGNK